MTSHKALRTRTGPLRTRVGPGLQSSPKSAQPSPVLGLFAVLGLDLQTLCLAQPTPTKLQATTKPHKQWPPVLLAQSKCWACTTDVWSLHFCWPRQMKIGGMHTDGNKHSAATGKNNGLDRAIDTKRITHHWQHALTWQHRSLGTYLNDGVLLKKVMNQGYYNQYALRQQIAQNGQNISLVCTAPLSCHSLLV